MLTFLHGISMGAAIGLSPGPVLVLILTQSAQYGIRAGLFTAAASTCATIPVVLAALIFQLTLQQSQWMQQMLAALGILFLLYLAWEAFKAPAVQMKDAPQVQPTLSFARGFLAASLFPVAYLFWITVGIPVAMAGHSDFSYYVLGIFVLGFMTALFTVNAVIAVFASRCGKSMSLRFVNVLCKSTSIIFLGFAVSLFYRIFWG